MTQKHQEFDIVDPQKRDWKGIVIALIAIMFICLLIVLAVLIFAPMSLTVRDSRTPIKLSNMSKLRSSIYDVRWSGTDSIIFEDVNKGVLLLNIDTMKTDVLIESRITAAYSQYIPSADLRYFALLHQTTYQVSHKFNRTYWISIANREMS
ncbi:Inactive dipeptidyl peptidase 10 [Parelaphostrongylus tenuis]|uniref:Inactive dipeptidyl peptidase 10 n=1 Tax=Parelaphostrongylus tenuis TaxID=148309 RepID=A0AAD5QJA9_PARTN|nr:Inactive dipeptidyl peptidase 10 [Parelaphostrongylus tenuis]